MRKFRATHQLNVWRHFIGSAKCYARKLKATVIERKPFEIPTREPADSDWRKSLLTVADHDVEILMAAEAKGLIGDQHSFPTRSDNRLSHEAIGNPSRTVFVAREARAFALLPKHDASRPVRTVL